MQDYSFFLFFYLSHRSQTVRRGGGLPQEAPFLSLLDSMRTIQFFLFTDS